MKLQIIVIKIVAFLFLASCARPAEEKAVWPALDPEVEAKVARLVRTMTLEEKVGQMTQITLDVLTANSDITTSVEPIVLDTAMLRKAFEQYHVGSVLNTPSGIVFDVNKWNVIVSQIQNYAMANSRLGIPVIYGLDMIHGASYVAGATFFPQQIGMAATWNPSLIERAGEITAYETRAAGVAWTFSPVQDLGLDPRWPRMWETFGEDPWLASIMGKSLIRGLQGPENQVGDKYRIAACLKHFIGYSQPLSGKDRTPAWIPDNKLKEYHLPPFAKGIEAGAKTIMLNSGEINGLPVHANRYLITDLLKNELGFKGFVVSDWMDIEYLHTRHKIAASHKEAIKIAINAGVDMSMVPHEFSRFANYLIELVREGEVSMERIDDAVTRILRIKYMLNLFEKPYSHAADYPLFASDEFSEAAFQTAVESVTLLKNAQNVLPLPKNARILVGGPAANTMRPLNGGWSYTWQGDRTDEFTGQYNTIFEAIKASAQRPENVVLFEGISFARTADFRDEIVGNLNAFARAARQADYIVLAIGENSYCETPGNITDLILSKNQQELVQVAAATGKPVILVLLQGRPRIIREIEPLAKGILNAYLPGNRGGDAIAGILFGDFNPSGKLPFTYPRYSNSLENYFHKHTEQLTGAGGPQGTGFNPQYPFGFGLSYSQFEYSDLLLEKSSIHPGDMVRGSVMVRNISQRDGKEVVQVFVSDHYASITPAVKRLRAFQKLLVPAGTTQKVTFEFPVNNLAFINLDNQATLEQGSFSLTIGPLSADFEVTETKVVR